MQLKTAVETLVLSRNYNKSTKTTFSRTQEFPDVYWPQVGERGKPFSAGNIRYNLCVQASSGVRGGRARRAATPGLKNSGQAQVAQKSWMIQNISVQWKISGQTLFFRASASCPKFWIIKNIYSIQWIQGTLFFRASTSSSNLLKHKKYFNKVKSFRATLFFRARKLFKNLNDKKSATGRQGRQGREFLPLP